MFVGFWKGRCSKARHNSHNYREQLRSAVEQHVRTSPNECCQCTYGIWPGAISRKCIRDSSIFPQSAPAVCSSSEAHQKLRLEANIYSSLLFDLDASTRARKNNSLISYHRHLPQTRFLESSAETITSNSKPLSQMETEGSFGEAMNTRYCLAQAYRWEMQFG